MDIMKLSLEKHREWKGKIEVVSRVPVRTKGDLSLAYTPGVAQACLEIAKDPEEAIEWIKARRMADHLLRTAKGESETGDQRSAADARESVIIDSISTMTANVLFDADEEGELPADFGQDITEAQAEEKAQSLLGQLKKLTEYADAVIILTEEPAAAPLYGKNEDLYLKALRTMNEAVFEMSDEVHRI